ncbi:MAG: leucyl-tRNA synthetase [Parcubacteria group bacterium Gr01-1014_38]|nr:MAG: leucyl-tRNA synthetase [Parcubacteria group bacterium Gr01-1014_38]
MPRKTDQYRPEEIEPRVQALWEKLGVFRTHDDAREPNEKRLYCLDMFPYPSGEGLHVGHVEGYTATDIYSRYMRMRGFDVLHPMGWDAFGLPAENAAIKQKTHPRTLVEKNVARFTEQLKRLGFSYDWSREIDTTDPAYYRWTQWIFLKLYHLGLAYEAEVPINWCPKDKTGLANEEVIDGKCERCGTPVTKRNLRQWLLRITKYADRLLRDLDQLDWPEGIKELQRNWIGKSEGTEVIFRAKAAGSRQRAAEIPLFTTRADTLFGATYVVLAPEHPLVEKITVPKQRAAVQRYVEKTRAKSDLERTALKQEKTGVDTGAKAVNPVNGEEIPIWVAEYVLASYGTGAIMAVPAHDERDFVFATEFKLPIREVVRPEHEQRRTPKKLTAAFVDDGLLVDSGECTGLPSADARKKITAWLETKELGKKSVQYKVRDWVFSRQRYWGEPIPIVHCEKCGAVPVPEEQLPVLLPDVESYEPTGTGESPLAAIAEWVQTSCPKCGKPAKRETNTMPQWAGSCWYFLRFCDPKNSEAAWSWEALERWMPVDLYVGGAEHAVLHLLYARFWMKALYDGGYLPIEEPFAKLRNQGIVLGPDGQKMSKSRGNVVNPDDIVAQYGADTLRLYEMFLGPLDAGKPWDPKSVPGVHRFLKRVWRIGEAVRSEKQAASGDEVRRALHRLVKKVGEDVEALKFNTAIAAMMGFLNLSESEDGVSVEDFKTFLRVLSPFAPHIAEALWQKLGEGDPIAVQPWPAYEPALIEEDTVQIVVQVDGKVRDQITMPRGASEADVRAAAERSGKVQRWLKGQKRRIKKVIVVPDRLVNFVVF